MNWNMYSKGPNNLCHVVPTVEWGLELIKTSLQAAFFLCS